MFRFLGRMAVRHAGIICLVWAGLAIVLTLIAPSWRAKTQDDDIHFLPAATPSVRAHQLLEQAFPQDVSASRALFCIERVESPLTATDLTLVDRLSSALQALKRDEPALQINGVTSRKTPVLGHRFVSKPRFEPTKVYEDVASGDDRDARCRTQPENGGSLFEDAEAAVGVRGEERGIGAALASGVCGHSGPHAGGCRFRRRVGDDSAIAGAREQDDRALGEGVIAFAGDGGSEAGEVEAEKAHGDLLDEQSRTRVLFRQ